MNPQRWEKQERRGVKTSYPVATSGAYGCKKLFSYSKLENWKNRNKRPLRRKRG